MGLGQPLWLGRKAMRAGLMPAASSQSAAAPNELPERPGPSSAIICRHSGRDARRAASAGESASLRANGSPVGRTVDGEAAPRAVATMAARLVPIERRPMTLAGPGGRRRAASP